MLGTKDSDQPEEIKQDGLLPASIFSAAAWFELRSSAKHESMVGGTYRKSTLSKSCSPEQQKIPATKILGLQTGLWVGPSSGPSTLGRLLSARKLMENKTRTT